MQIRIAAPIRAILAVLFSIIYSQAGAPYPWLTGFAVNLTGVQCGQCGQGVALEHPYEHPYEALNSDFVNLSGVQCGQGTTFQYPYE